jgi:hypothetical protein
MHELNRAGSHVTPGATDDTPTDRLTSPAPRAKPDYLPPEITTLTEADILAVLGPAHTGSMENPFGVDGLGGL